MKTLLTLALLIATFQLSAQFRPLSDITAGALVGFEPTIGVHFQASNFFFQTRFSTQYRPDENGFDHTHTHNFGVASRITNKIEVLYGGGYNSLWNGEDRKLAPHGTFGFAFRDEIVKIMVVSDIDDEFTHEFSLGILFAF